ncbi:MAG TPA: hypothetical protein VH413_16010 [Verrucomicrobiae bacterium]|jgi:hypothetical protein|nr:hypothetical protein [Verrucomicrobiae bacterium]
MNANLRFRYNLTPAEPGKLCVLLPTLDAFEQLVHGQRTGFGAAVNTDVRLNSAQIRVFETEHKVVVDLIDCLMVKAAYWQNIAAQYPAKTLDEIEILLGERPPELAPMSPSDYPVEDFTRVRCVLRNAAAARLLSDQEIILAVQKAIAEYRDTDEEKPATLFTTSPHNAQRLSLRGPTCGHAANDLFTLQDEHEFSQITMTGAELEDLLLKWFLYRRVKQPAATFDESTQNEDWQIDVARELNLLLEKVRAFNATAANNAPINQIAFHCALSSLVRRVAEFESIEVVEPVAAGEATEA